MAQASPAGQLVSIRLLMLQSSPREAILGNPNAEDFISCSLAVPLGKLPPRPSARRTRVAQGRRGLGDKEVGRGEERREVGKEKGGRKQRLNSRTMSYSHLGVPYRLLMGNYFPDSN